MSEVGREEGSSFFVDGALHGFRKDWHFQQTARSKQMGEGGFPRTKRQQSNPPRNADFAVFALGVQVPNNHILTQNLYYNYYYPHPKYLIIGYMDPNP